MLSITELGRPEASFRGLGRASPTCGLMTTGLCLLHLAETLEFRAKSLSLDREPLRASTDFFHQTGCFGAQDRASPIRLGLLIIGCVSSIRLEVL